MVNLHSAAADRLRKNMHIVMGRLRIRADQVVATPPTLANLDELPHVLDVLATIDQAQAHGLNPLWINVQINKLAEAQDIATTAVQHLVDEAQTTLAGLEFRRIQDCATLLRHFVALMALIDPNYYVCEGFQSLDEPIEDFKALVVDKATAMLQDVVATASPNVATTPWPQLLRNLGDFEDLLSIDPTIFLGAATIRSLMDQIVSVFCPPPAEATILPVQQVHVNQVVRNLYNNPTSPHLATTASSAFGGVCSNVFRSPASATFERMWVNAPLPKSPSSRAIAVNWITTHLYEQASLLRAQCQVDVRSQESADGHSKSITLHSLSDDTYFQEKHSVIHVLHLPRHKTYHLTTYREHIVHLPFEKVVQWRKTRLAANDAKSPPREKFGGISLRFVASAYGIKAKSSSNQYILTREFDGDAEYCVVATSITKDDDKAKCPEPVGYKREWTSWMIITKLDDSTTSVVQMSVATGLQHSHGAFVPYDNYVQALHSVTSADLFEMVARQLKKHSAVVFENDAQRCIKELKAVGSSASVVKVESAAATNDDYGEDHDMDGITIKDEGTGSTSNSHAASDALDMHSVLVALPAPARSARTPTIVATPGHFTTSSAARAGPICNRYGKRGRDDSSDEEETKRARSDVRFADELRPALAILTAKRIQLLGTKASSPAVFSWLVMVVCASPLNALVVLCLQDDDVALRTWVHTLLCKVAQVVTGNSSMRSWMTLTGTIVNRLANLDADSDSEKGTALTQKEITFVDELRRALALLKAKRTFLLGSTASSSVQFSWIVMLVRSRRASALAVLGMEADQLALRNWVNMELRNMGNKLRAASVRCSE